MSLIKNTSVYLISNILNAAIPFILLPILTRYLTPAEYGQIAMFQVLLAGITTFIGLNSIGAANRKFYDSDIDTNTLREFNGSCIQILTVSSLIAIIFTYIMAEKLSSFFSIPAKWIFLSIVISILTFIATLRLGQWQIRSQAKKFGLLQIGGGIINMLVSLQLVILLKQGADGRINAQLITALIIAIISIILLYKDKLIKIFIWRPIQIKEALLFGIPLIPHHIGFFLISSVDRFFINKEIGLAEAGIYMVAVQLSTSFAILFDAINKAYIPWLFNKLKENKISDKIKIVKYTYFYFLVIIIMAIISFLIGPTLFIFIAGEKYSEGGELIGWLCLGQIFGGMYLMVTNYIFFSKKTGRLSLITITTGLLNIVLLIILIQYFGVIGAAFSFAITKLCQFLFTWILACNLVSMPWFKKEG